MNYGKTLFFGFLCSFGTSFVHAMNNEANGRMDQDLFEFCMQNDFVSLQEELIKRPKQLEKTDSLGNSFLWLAVKRENKEAIKCIIEQCPSLLLTANQGNQLPIHGAAWTGRKGLCRALILSPQVSLKKLTDFRTITRTCLLIHKRYKNEKNLGLLPKVVLLNLILKPLSRSLLLPFIGYEEYVQLHKERINTMLSHGKQKPFELLDKEEELDSLRLLLDPTNVSQFDEVIEKLYRIIN